MTDYRGTETTKENNTFGLGFWHPGAQFRRGS